MKFEPITTRSARAADGRVRLYAAPMFVRPDGKRWTTAYDAARLIQRGDAFRVEYGDDWAELGPSTPLIGLKEAVSESGHFGWRLDASKAADGLGWSLKHSKGAERTADGVVLGRPDGVPLGLFWADWRQHKPHIVDDWLTIDVSAAKAQAVSEYEAAGSPTDSYPLLDLDPTTQLAAYSRQYLYMLRILTETPWTECRDELAATSQASADLYVQNEPLSATNCNFYRSALAFDTSGYSTEQVLRSWLWMYANHNSLAAQPNSPYSFAKTHVSRGAGFTVWDDYDYGRVRSAGYETQPAGYMAITQGGQNPKTVEAWFKVQTSGVYYSENPHVLALATEEDVDNNVDMDCRNVWDGSGANAPYLELTLVPITAHANYYRRMRT